MPPPYFTEEENEFALPIPAVCRPLAKIGLAVYASVFLVWLAHTVTH